MAMTGWPCSACGTFISWNQNHRCLVPSTGGNPTTYSGSAGPRKYRVKGRISSVERAGTYYDVDLVVEAIP